MNPTDWTLSNEPNWLNAEKECGSVLRGHLWGGHKERLCSRLPPVNWLTFCQDRRKVNVLNSRPFPCSVLTPYSVLPCQNVWTYVRWRHKLSRIDRLPFSITTEALLLSKLTYSFAWRVFGFSQDSNSWVQSRHFHTYCDFRCILFIALHN